MVPFNSTSFVGFPGFVPASTPGFTGFGGFTPGFVPGFVPGASGGFQVTPWGCVPTFSGSFSGWPITTGSQFTTPTINGKFVGPTSGGISGTPITTGGWSWPFASIPSTGWTWGGFPINGFVPQFGVSGYGTPTSSIPTIGSSPITSVTGFGPGVAPGFPGFSGFGFGPVGFAPTTLGHPSGYSTSCAPGFTPGFTPGFNPGLSPGFTPGFSGFSGGFVPPFHGHPTISTPSSQTCCEPSMTFHREAA